METQRLKETERALEWDHMAPQPSPRERVCVAWDAPEPTLPRSAHCGVLWVTTGWMWPRQRRLGDNREKETGRETEKQRRVREAAAETRETDRDTRMRWLQALRVPCSGSQ